MCRELVAKVLNMFKNFMRIFSPKYFARLSCDCHATVAERLCVCREPVAAKFRRIYNVKFSRHSYECCASVARRSCDSFEKTCEYLATIWRENKTKQHSYECHATVVRIKMKKCYIRGKVMRHSLLSRDCHATVALQSRDTFSNLDLNSRICRINVYSMRLQCESCVYIVNLCRKIVTNYSQTSLQLSHSSEIRALARILFSRDKEFANICKN